MPTYDYICELCNKEFELFHSISDNAKRFCPFCQKEGLKRKIGAGAGVIFKGNGFYETDYKRKKEEPKKEAKKEVKKEEKTCSPVEKKDK